PVLCYLARHALRTRGRDRPRRATAGARHQAAPPRRRAARLARVLGAEEPRAPDGDRRAGLRRHARHAVLAPGDRRDPRDRPRVEALGRARAGARGARALLAAARAPLRPRRAPLRASARRLARARARRPLDGGARLRRQAALLEEELHAPLRAAERRAPPHGRAEPRRAAPPRHPAGRGRAPAGPRSRRGGRAPRRRAPRASRPFGEELRALPSRLALAVQVLARRPGRGAARRAGTARAARRSHRRARSGRARARRRHARAHAREAARPLGAAHAQGARGARGPRQALRRRRLGAHAHRRGHADARRRAVRPERRARVGAVAGRAPRGRLERASVPAVRQRRLRRRQGERVPHAPAARVGADGGGRAAAMRLASGFVAALAALMPLAPAHAAAPIEVRDDRGVAVALEAPARRIVALAPHLAEIAYAAGAGDRLVGVSNFSDFPPEAKRLPVVFDWGRVDYERVIALRPDVVLAWRSGTPALQVERLERLGMKVVVTEVRHFADVAALERTVGRIAGTEASAETAARDFENRLAALRAEYAARPALSVFLEIWHAPMITINGDHVFSEAIELCGGRNVFAR